MTSFLTTLYDDYTRSEVQGKLKETFKKQYKLTTWVEVQIRYKTVWVISPAGIPVPTQVPYEYRIFHTKLVNNRCFRNMWAGAVWQMPLTLAKIVGQKSTPN